MLCRWVPALTGVVSLLAAGGSAAWGAATTQRASVTSSGQQADGQWPSISGDGRYVAFFSKGAPFGVMFDNVYVRDRTAKTTMMVGLTPAGTPPGNSCTNPAISRDGHFVAYQSATNDIVPGQSGIFLRDLRSRASRAVSVGSGGQRINGIAQNGTVSATGRYVAYYSNATNIVSAPGLSSSVFQLYVRDMQTGKTTLETKGPTGAAGDRGAELFAAVSITPDGRYIAFTSYSSNLVAGDDNNNMDVFLRDRQAGKTALVSVRLPGHSGFGAYSYNPFVSDNGRLVAFSSLESNLAPGGSNGRANIFVRDMVNKATARLALGLPDGFPNGDLQLRGMSPDGRFVVFVTDAPNMVANDTNGFFDVFLHDRNTQGTTRLSVSSGNVQGNGNSGYGYGVGVFPGYGWISAKGNIIAFPSAASNLVKGDTNGSTDVFVRVLPIQTSVAGR